MKKIYTTSEVARLCHVTAKTVVNWIETGKLKCMKTGGGFRKVFREELLRFMEANNIPFEDDSKKILIIDDNPDDVHIMEEILQLGAHALRIDHAYDGEEGLFKIGVYKPDLVILDIFMPRLDGFKVYDLIKATPAMTGTQVLFVTGQAEDAIMVRLKKHGIDSFMTKPLEHERFYATISALLKKES